jgi:hypothetical protein
MAAPVSSRPEFRLQRVRTFLSKEGELNYPAHFKPTKAEIDAGFGIPEQPA